MNGYLPPHEACEKAGITAYVLTKLIGQGKVRTLSTVDITSSRNSPLKFVCLQDIRDALAGIELVYVDISVACTQYGVTPSAVRYHIRRGRVRWRRDGTALQPCKPDLDLFVEDADTRPSGRPRTRVRDPVPV